MTLQNASWLWWLLPLGGVIILLYLLKMRRRDVRVPATFLWPARIEEIRANSLFQRLRFSWLLVLQLLALSLIVFALTKPQTMQQGLTGKVSVLVIDSSASMAATDVQPSRFTEAVHRAQAAIRGAGTGDRIAIIEAGPTPRVVAALSADPARQLQALQGLEVSDAESDVGEALRLAASLVGNEDSARIVLLSDGDFTPIQDFSPGKASLLYQCIGSSGANLAVSALGTADAANGRQLFCGIKNYGKEDSGAVITILGDGKVIDSQKINVPAGKQWGQTLSVPVDVKVFEAKLGAKDVLEADNYAVALTDPGASLHVLLVSNGDFFLERALALDPRVTLDRAAAVPEEEKGSPGGSKYDLIVFDGITEEPVKARSVLTFGAAGASSPVTVAGEAKHPRYVSAEAKPLMNGVDLSSLFIDSAEQVKAKGLGEVFAQSSDGPLVVASSGVAQRQIYVSFRPMNSDFPLQVGFPIFIANALDFSAAQQGSATLLVKTGSPFTVPLSTSASLTLPSGATMKTEPTGAVTVVRETRRIGKYVLDSGRDRRTIYATLKSERESAVEPEKEIKLGGGDVKAVKAPVRLGDFWRPLVLLCLLVLAVEWWMFARRS